MVREAKKKLRRLFERAVRHENWAGKIERQNYYACVVRGEIGMLYPPPVIKKFKIHILDSMNDNSIGKDYVIGGGRVSSVQIPWVT